jgi:hypothetical protein
MMPKRGIWGKDEQFEYTEEHIKSAIAKYLAANKKDEESDGCP